LAAVDGGETSPHADPADRSNDFSR
jgi:hypothetical protein